MTTEETLAGVLRRFISRNKNDYGYVDVDEDNQLILDGRVQLTAEEFSVVMGLLDA